MGRDKGKPRLLGHDTPFTELNAKRPSLCPECVAEKGFIEAHWDLALMTGCPVHRRLLVSHCLPLCQSLALVQAWTIAMQTVTLQSVLCGRDSLEIKLNVVRAILSKRIGVQASADGTAGGLVIATAGLGSFPRQRWLGLCAEHDAQVPSGRN